MAPGACATTRFAFLEALTGPVLHPDTGGPTPSAPTRKWSVLGGFAIIPVFVACLNCRTFPTSSGKTEFSSCFGLFPHCYFGHGAEPSVNRRSALRRRSGKDVGFSVPALVAKLRGKNEVRLSLLLATPKMTLNRDSCERLVQKLFCTSKAAGVAW